jgi:hypothetical protein
MKTYSKQSRNLATIITGVGLTFFSITAEAETIGYEQSPGHFGAFGSDGQVGSVADEFQLDQSALIRNITWWGGYDSTVEFPPPVADDFTIRLFADQSGKPGVLVGEFNVGNDANRVATGDFVNPPGPPDDFDPFPGRAEFKYSFDLPGSFVAKANTRYWLSIVNVPVTDGWDWEVSDSPINPGVQRSFMDPVFGPWEPYFVLGGPMSLPPNTAFQVGIDPVEVSDSPEPSSVILLATVVGLTMFMGRRRRRTQGAAPCGRGGW